MEQEHLKEIHNFIEKHTLGVSISDLMVNASIKKSDVKCIQNTLFSG